MATQATQYLSGHVARRDGVDNLSTLKEVLKWVGGAYVIVREYGKKSGKEHYHYLLVTTRDITSIRNKFTRSYPSASGDQTWSCRKAAKGGGSWDGARNYVFKGDSEHPDPRGGPPDVIESYGIEFTREKIAEYHEAYWKISSDIKANKNCSFADHVLFYMSTNNKPFTVEAVTEAVVEMTLHHKKVVNEFYMAGVIKMVMAKKNTAYKKELCRRLVDMCTPKDGSGCCENMLHKSTTVSCGLDDLGDF